ncbi:lysophospholipid acyltransferase family protein [Prosthecomicrobium sp. N25]|uniref:lysophospholipid acyltransferase family protein n=1 Tax=Prosthecomicrobium sp. N25 TaxID=3129254 RepID=UPI003076E427
MPATDLSLRLRNRLEAIGLDAAGSLFRSMDVDRASALGGRLWRRFAPLSRRHARALVNLQIAFPELDAYARRAIALDMWENLGRVLAESFHMPAIAADASRIDTTRGAILETVRASGRGAVLASLHTGNWELGAQVAMRFGLSPAGVYQTVRNPHVEALFRTLRAAWYPAGLHARQRDGAQTAMKLIGIVRRGGTIAIMGDLRDAAGVEVPFFGRPTWATPFPAMVARALDVPLVAARMIRTGGVRFDIDAVEVAVPRSDDREGDIRAGTAALQATYEGWIREYPGQWFWIHRKWAPPGDRAR